MTVFPKRSDLSFTLSSANRAGKRDGFMPFSRVLAQNKMQTFSLVHFSSVNWILCIILDEAQSVMIIIDFNYYCNSSHQFCLLFKLKLTKCPVSWSNRIHWQHLWREVNPPPTLSVLDMTLNPLMVRLQLWRFRQCTVTLSLSLLPGPLWPSST